MAASIDRLQSLRVADVMSRQVTPVSTNQTMKEAATLFVKRKITGAPVIDEQGHCVGMLSASDFVFRESVAGQASSSLTPCEQRVVRDAADRSWQIEDVFNDFVCAHMSPAVQTVDGEVALVEASRIMCSQHIHRLPVLDEKGCPVGIVTSLDVVAAMVNVIDELSAPNAAATSPENWGLTTNPDDASRQSAGDLWREHVRLKRRLDALRDTMAQETDQTRLANLLDEFCLELETHFQHEETGDCFEQVVAVAPRLSERVDAVLRQHPALLAMLGDIVEMARQSVKLETLLARFESFATKWLRHETEENDLLHEAYNVDIGTHD